MMRGAIFDVDGTLLDSMGIWDDLGARYLRSIQVEPEEGLQDILACMTVEEGAAYVKGRYHLAMSEEEIVENILQIIEDFYYNEASLKPGVFEYLEKCRERHIPMTVATSSIRDHVEAAFRRLGILKYFDKIFTCTEIGIGKTQPDIYQAAASFMGLRPQDVYVFEDAIHALKTAKDAGFYTVAVYDPASEKDWEVLKKIADVGVENMTELP